MSEPEREVMETDVLVVGAGPSGLATAIHLARRAKEAGGDPPMIMVLEKGAELGNHILSGAVMDPRGLDELIPDWKAQGAPIEAKVSVDAVRYLTSSSYWTLPITPPPMNNHGNYVISLQEMVKWLGEQAEELEIEIFPGFAAQELIVEDGVVKGVVSGDMGISKEGEQKGTYQPGMEIRAKVTVLSEGTRGHLAKKLCSERELYQQNPQIYSTGIKEIWKLPKGRFPAGHVLHTMGYPMQSDTFGGTWIYGMRDDLLSIGLVVGLDSPDPRLDPHNLFQRWKQHPMVSKILEGGELDCYGAKTIPDGGWYSRPNPVVPGCLMVGDSGGNMNPARLKGIHLAIKTGMLAAETIEAALAADDFGEKTLGRYREKVEASWVKTELWKYRNFRAPYQKHGLWGGMIHTGLQEVTGGRGLVDPFPLREDHELTQKVTERPSMHERLETFDGTLTQDKLSDVFKGGTEHEEDQPSHLLVSDFDVCETKCTKEYGNPCQYFCPAAVYEMVAKDEDDASKGNTLQINASNCVHCKTCDIADPYELITWVAPEGGGGPKHRRM
jgi:electron-transferring-flavoprotein dehydrogenase